MKTMEFARIPDFVENTGEWPRVLEGLKRYKIDCVNWREEYPYCPDVSCAAAWNKGGFFLNYRVNEQQLRAINDEYNSAVWEDSCVEFFFQFDPGDRHYSFEFNPVGAFLGQINYIKSGDWIAPEELGKIKLAGSHTDLSAPLLIENETDWNISIFIPFDLVAKEERTRLVSGGEFMVNFFKCGDKCREPHFLSWNPIDWPQPSFHRPQFFGKGKLL